MVGRVITKRRCQPLGRWTISCESAATSAIRSMVGHHSTWAISPETDLLARTSKDMVSGREEDDGDERALCARRRAATATTPCWAPPPAANRKARKRNWRKCEKNYL